MEQETRGQELLHWFHVRLVTILNVSLTSACFILETFSCQKAKLGLGTTLCKCQITRLSGLLDVILKKFLLYFNMQEVC